MRYSHLKNADVDVSQIAVGTWAMGGDSFDDNDDIPSSMRAIQTMLEQGVNLIDTAPCYGNGTAEKIVGRALKGIERDKYLLSTKVGLVTSPSGYDRDSSFKNIIEEIPVRPLKSRKQICLIALPDFLRQKDIHESKVIVFLLRKG